IEIAYGGGRSVRISPADREGFLARLEPRLAAPGIISRVDGAAPNGGKAITYGIFEGFDSDEANAVGRLSFWFSVFLMAFTVPVATAAGIYGGRIGMYVVAYLGCACMWATVFVTSRQAAKVQSHIDGHGTDAAGRRGARGRAIGYASLFASVAVLLAVAAFFIIY
ncbi:MAG: PH domain-containing protein, partial [Methanomassiliicoccaceae archaeon]|nr:PH domain-containing protein [Methanomassiliicoccaceae archaeon]